MICNYLFEQTKAQLVTRGIKNCRDSRLFKGCSPLKLLCNLTGNRPQSATFHTANVNATSSIPDFIVWLPSLLLSPTTSLPYVIISGTPPRMICPDLSGMDSHPHEKKYMNQAVM